MSAGYENTFIKDFNGDGLISGGSYYQLLGDNGAVNLNSWNDNTSSEWNVTAAKNNSTSFQVLFEGESALNGYNNIWTVDASGNYSSSTSWLTDAQTVSAGYEVIFNKDINNDGLIS